MAELLKVFKAITDKSGLLWREVTDTDKVECFFIINRNFSKIYPDKAQMLNNKEVDKIAVMNLWWLFMRTQPFPAVFWSKAPEKASKPAKGEYTEKDINLLIEKIGITQTEFNLLHLNYKGLLDEELKYYKKLEKEE